tara:strand:+ start:127 stop:552 length:426 start_codon:yes stop_codon:yes gene_type:complete
MSTYKVKYATRNKLARALQMEIKNLGLVADWAMYDSVRISAMTGTELNRIDITVSVLYYYFFLDEGTIYIDAFDITDRWLDSPTVQSIIGEITQDYIQWQFEKYPLLEMAKILNNPKVFVNFNWIDENKLPYKLPDRNIQN